LNCFTPVACAVETRLNGGNRLVSTYGANPAAPPEGAPPDGLGEELAGPLEAELAGLVREGVAEPLGERGAERLGVGDGDGADGDEGAGLAGAVGVPAAPEPPAWHGAPLMVQPAGCPAAAPEAEVTKPTVTVPPGATVASQLSFFTVTWPPSSVYEPSQREDSAVPFGSAKASVQPVTAAVPGLVIVYWPL
jgi:hypothetical protein